jgi:mono/diheme cytochrome c family protein
MKKYLIITGIFAMGISMFSCNKVRRNPGRTYMPDMAYSRSLETYASTEELEKKGIHYSGKPVEGTMAIGDMFPYPLKNDEQGYAQSAAIKNPLPAESVDMVEAERLYLIYCGICHGAKLDGNGPLFNGGDGPFPAAPKNFIADDMKAMTEGTMFHSVTYGKGMMGSYASQLSTKQRWEVIAYIKSKQAETAAAKP